MEAASAEGPLCVCSGRDVAGSLVLARSGCRHQRGPLLRSMCAIQSSHQVLC